MKKLLLTALLLAPQLHAMQMETAKTKSLSNTCGNAAKACCFLWLTASANAANCFDTFPKTTECTAMQGNPCVWNPQYQSVHYCDIRYFGLLPLEYAYVWDNRLGHALDGDDCNHDTRKGTVSHVLKSVYARENRRDKIEKIDRDCQELYAQTDADDLEAIGIINRALVQLDIVFSSKDAQTWHHDIEERDAQHMACVNRGIYPKEKQD